MTVMRASCAQMWPGLSGSVPCPALLHKSLGGADVWAVARLATLEPTPSSEQSSSVSRAPAHTDRLAIPVAWGGTEVLAGTQDYSVQDIWSLLHDSEPLEIHPRPFLALCVLSLHSHFQPLEAFFRDGEESRVKSEDAGSVRSFRCQFG